MARPPIATGGDDRVAESRSFVALLLRMTATGAPRYGGRTRLHLYTMLTRHIARTLAGAELQAQR